MFAGELPGLGPVIVSIRQNPQAALGCKDFDPVSFAVDDAADLRAWADHLHQLGVAHSPVIEPSISWLLVFSDPDGLQVHLYSWAVHGIDQPERSGYGHRITA